jgi:hypothetical protein
MYFFVACAAMVAYSFRRAIASGESNLARQAWMWHARILSTAVALVAGWLVFTALCMTLRPPHHVVAAWLGLMLIVPCLGIVPYMILVTRQPFAAVVLSMTLVVCVKLAGCIVVVAVYGWNANEFGHTAMPWMRPNLLVWCFWIGTTILSAACYFHGARRWCCSGAGQLIET